MSEVPNWNNVGDPRQETDVYDLDSVPIGTARPGRLDKDRIPVAGSILTNADLAAGFAWGYSSPDGGLAPGGGSMVPDTVGPADTVVTEIWFDTANDNKLNVGFGANATGASLVSITIDGTTVTMNTPAPLTDDAGVIIDTLNSDFPGTNLFGTTQGSTHSISMVIG